MSDELRMYADGRRNGVLAVLDHLQWRVTELDEGYGYDATGDPALAYRRALTDAIGWIENLQERNR